MTRLAQRASLAVVLLLLASFGTASTGQDPRGLQEFRVRITEAARVIRTFQTPSDVLFAWGDPDAMEGVYSPIVTYNSRLGIDHIALRYGPPAAAPHRLRVITLVIKIVPTEKD
jgi:hypothetical protein